MIPVAFSNLGLAGRIYQGISPLIMLNVAMHPAITDQEITALITHCQKGAEQAKPHVATYVIDYDAEPV